MSAFLCAIPLIGGLLSACPEAHSLAVGYAEGEFVLAAPIETAEIVSVSVRRGDRVKSGSPLVELEKRDAEIAVAQARASLAQAESNLANLRQGRRPEEIAAIQASLASAKAQADQAAKTYSRQSDLLDRGIATQATFDSAETSLELARAKVTELQANLAVAQLSARKDEIAAANAQVEQADAALEQAEWRLEQRSISVPVDGIVYDIVRNPGEVAGPQAPVLSVLPDGAVKLRLYAPEEALSSLALGDELTVRCDGCAENTRATISYISPEPEFTPPVIYSLENRQKLVYLVEARPEADDPALKPGQIVDVDLEFSDR
ncbi:MAG: HlyD family secretion protein [Rhizobiales bacterium]|nr:HlyD family secretion protein [Hyphomicrobiales bacterium]MBA70970.1 HlyD family secretion protein [Hyphomicrobiales bacterium]|tara:strand:- start:359 stop:1315 length:957 start_codon:yes stop_codon:yes gene_type:complete